MLYPTFKTLIDILRLKSGPQDLPSSAGLLALFVVALIALQGLLGRSFIPEDPGLFAQATLSVLVTLGWLNVLLRLFDKAERFVQTATAIFGIALLLTPLSVPLVAAVRPGEDGTVTVTPLSLLAVALSMYLIYVNARILREALERPMFQCVMLFLAGELLAFALVIATGIGLPPR